MNFGAKYLISSSSFTIGSVDVTNSCTDVTNHLTSILCQCTKLSVIFAKNFRLQTINFPPKLLERFIFRCSTKHTKKATLPQWQPKICAHLCHKNLKFRPLRKTNLYRAIHRFEAKNISRPLLTPTFFVIWLFLADFEEKMKVTRKNKEVWIWEGITENFCTGLFFFIKHNKGNIVLWDMCRFQDNSAQNRREN